LSDETQNAQDETNPGTPNAGSGAEWDIFQTVALCYPRFAESDVSETDGTPEIS